MNAETKMIRDLKKMNALVERLDFLMRNALGSKKNYKKAA